MNAMHRHMLWQLLLCSGAICLALTFAVVLLNTFGLFELWRMGTMPLPEFLLANLLTAPPIICQTGPLSIAIGTAFLYHGWIRNSEITALRAAGLSWRSIALPGVAAGAIAMLCTGATSLYILSATFPTLADVVFASRATLSYAGLQEGYMNEIGPTAALAFQHRRSFDTLGDVTLLQWPDPGKLYVVTAESGTLTKTAEGEVLVLERGHMQRQIGNQKEAPVTFDRMNALVRPAIGLDKRGKGYYEKPVGQLLFPTSKPTGEGSDYYYRVAEGHQRIITPLVCLNYVLLCLGVLLAGGASRAGLTARIVGFGVAIATLHITMVITHGIVAHHPALLPFFYLYAVVPGIVGGALLLRDDWRGSGSGRGVGRAVRHPFADVAGLSAEASSR
jgi:lipopolysaccharide export system permease protein